MHIKQKIGLFKLLSICIFTHTLLDKQKNAMANFITTITEVGINHKLPEYLKHRVQPTNIVALSLIFFVAIPFVVISLVYLPPSMAIIPALGGITCLIVLFINYSGGIHYSRLPLSILPIVLAASYNALLCQTNDEPITGVYLIELAFSLVPFVVFDFREKKFLLFTAIFSFLLIVGFPITKEWVNVIADVTVLREGWLMPVTNVLGVLTAFGCIIGMGVISSNSEKRNVELLGKMSDRNHLLEETQAKSEENLKKIKKAQEEEQRRNWAAEGITEVSEILRSNKESKEIFDTATSSIIKYIGANQGGLYIVEKDEENEENTVIKLASCYAFSRKKYLEQEYTPGQGLLGQVYLEEEYLLMTDIPQEYVTITSGLGDANPKALIIIPLMINEEVEGLLEIASFKAFEEHHIKFLHKVGENIASYIQTNRINQRTVTLLENAQTQTEEMRAQEEEMKQNMEELSATQEEMNRKEKEYHKMIEDLKAEIVGLKESA